MLIPIQPFNEPQLEDYTPITLYIKQDVLTASKPK